jgi:chaperonin GroES
MTFTPLYDRIAVKRIAEKQRTESGLYIPDAAKEKPSEGEIFAVGAGRFTQDGQMIPLSVKVGDRVLFGKYSGADITVDGQELIVMREDELLGVLA